MHRVLRTFATQLLKMDAIVLKTTSAVPHDAMTAASVAHAAALLQADELVALPTETVYGLGASALSAAATAKIYLAKGRPSDNPLIVHVSSLAMLHSLLPGGAASVPAAYEPLLSRFWPGPLSLLFPLSSPALPPPARTLAPAVTAGLPSVAIRMPAHPLALALIAAADLPIAAPSANLSSRPSPTTAQHVQFDLGSARGVAAILDGGECVVGVESTVVDFKDGEVRVLRVGGVSAGEIGQCLSEAGFGGAVPVWRKDFESGELDSRPTTPGMKYRHYAPTNASVVLVRPEERSDDVAASNLPQSLLDLIDQLLPPEKAPDTTRRIGLMLTASTLERLFPTDSPDYFSRPLSLPPSASPTPTSNASDSSPPPILLSHTLGSTPAEAAQRLFAGLRHFDELPPENDLAGKSGVDLILVECVPEDGVGGAVMERARKAAAGGDEVRFVLPPR